MILHVVGPNLVSKLINLAREVSFTDFASFNLKMQVLSGNLRVLFESWYSEL